MNEQKLRELLGNAECENIMALSKQRSDMVKGIIESLPPGAKIKNVRVGAEENDFINNNITVIIKFKI